MLIPGELLLTSVTASSLKRVRELCASWQLNVPFNTNPRDAPLILTDIKVCFAGLRARPPVHRQASVSVTIVDASRFGDSFDNVSVMAPGSEAKNVGCGTLYH